MDASARLRVATTGDAASLAAIYAPYVRDTNISFELDPPDADEMRLRIAATGLSHPWLVAEADGRLLGYAYASPHRAREAYAWSCDVTVYLDPSAQGRGLGSRLYTELLRCLTAQGFVSAFGGIALPNAASVALHEKLGFRHLGTYSAVGFKRGLWTDVGWWQRTLQDDRGAPAPIIPFPALGI